jgi:SAM-dependent methyltransferase
MVTIRLSVAGVTLVRMVDECNAKEPAHGPDALPGRAGEDAEPVDWDAEAASFDDEPDHGLRDPGTSRAWADRLRGWLPPHPADVLDLGCGTGSLSRLAARQGHRVTGVDLSTAMLARARAKCAGLDAEFLAGDASAPPVGERRFDVVLVRHVLWALPRPERVLRGWRDLLRPAAGGGRFVLVEGVWGTVAPAGVAARRLVTLLEPLGAAIRVERLSDETALWGRTVTDERYAVIATL